MSLGKASPERIREANHFSFAQTSCTLKGGPLSIVPHELLLAFEPSAPGLDHGIATWHTSGG